MAITRKESKTPDGGRIDTLVSDSGGGTSEWIPVPRMSAGLDLIVIGGSARLERTSGDPTVYPPTATAWTPGDIAAGNSATSVVDGASHVRLVATGVAIASIRG